MLSSGVFFGGPPKHSQWYVQTGLSMHAHIQIAKQERHELEVVQHLVKLILMNNLAHIMEVH